MDKDPADGRIVLRRGMKQFDWRTEAPAMPSATAGLPELRLGTPPVPRLALPRLSASPLVKASLGVMGVSAVILLFIALSFHLYKAEGQSMEPGLHNGDRLLVGRLAYGKVDFGLLDFLPFYDSSDLRWGSPDRGDVVILQSPVQKEKLVKRVIGVPGDVVRIREGRVYVNGVAIAEPYAKGETECLQACGNIIVPEGRYFVLGDNRENSIDSRQGWTIPRDDISGKVILSY